MSNSQKLPRPIPFQHLSLKVGDSTPYKWARVLNEAGNFVTVPATQGSMDQMEESRLMILLGVLRAIRSFVGGQKMINRWIGTSSGFSHIFRDLNPVYQMDKLGDGEGGTWTTDPSGKHYSIENYAMGDIQKLCLNKDNFAQAAALSQDYKDFLDIRVQGTKIEVGALFVLPPAPDTYDKAVSKLGPITADHSMKPLSTDQKAKLVAATNAHQHTGEDPHKTVQELLKIFEDSALDEEQRHFFQMMQFNCGSDPRWSSADKALIGELEEITWGFWFDELMKIAPNWGISRYWEIAHQQAHALNGFNSIANLSDVQVVYRFPCIGRSGKPEHIGDCPEETQAQVMSRLRNGIYLQGLS